MERIEDLRDEALENAKRSMPIDAKLASIFPSPESLRAAIKEADEVALRFGLDRDASKQLYFDAESQGFRSDFRQVARNSLVLGVQGASEAAGGIREQFPGVTTAESSNILLKAAQTSKLDPEQFVRSSPDAAQAGRTIGASIEETFAIQSQLANLKKSGQEAATSMRAFARVARKEGFAGEGFMTAISKFRELDEESFNKVIGGNQEALEGMRDIEFLSKSISTVQGGLVKARAASGTENSTVMQALRANISLPTTRAAIASNRTQLRSELRKEQMAVAAASIEADEVLLRDTANPDVLFGTLQSIPVIGDAVPSSQAQAIQSMGEIGGADTSRTLTRLLEALGFTSRWTETEQQRSLDRNNLLKEQNIILGQMNSNGNGPALSKPNEDR